MKHIVWGAALITITAAIAMGQSTTALNVGYPGYSLVIPASLEGVKDADLVPFVSGKMDSLPEKAAQSRFGILFRDDAKNLGSAVLMELIDPATNKAVRKITLNEYFGKENGSWTQVADESKATDVSITAVFKFPFKGTEMKFIREITLNSDDALPLGKKLEVRLSLQGASEQKLKVRFLGRAEGAFVALTNAFAIINTEPLSAVKPGLLFSLGAGQPVSIESLKKGKQQNFTLTTSPITVAANEKTPVLTFVIVGTSGAVKEFNEHVIAQLKNCENYLSKKKTAPQVVLLNTANKLKIAAKDTITYTIYYHNIGTAPATDFDVISAISPKTEYIDKSAENPGTTLKLVRKEAKAPAISPVTSLIWNDKTKINSGEERWVRYKVVVR